MTGFGNCVWQFLKQMKFLVVQSAGIRYNVSIYLIAYQDVRFTVYFIVKILRQMTTSGEERKVYKT